MPSRLTPFFPEDRHLPKLRAKAGLIFSSNQQMSTALSPAEKLLAIEDCLIESVIMSSRIEGEEPTGQFQDANPGCMVDLRAQRLLHAYRNFELKSGELYSGNSIKKAHSLWATPWVQDEVPLIAGIPGEFRKVEVIVGRHLAPSFGQIQLMIDRVSEAQRWLRSPEDLLLSLFTLNHRFLWIHPFADGNGRISRLLLEAGLKALGLGELWSFSSVLYKNQEAYFAKIRMADRPRQGDLDGRGSLSTSGLLAYLEFMLDCCIEAISDCHSVNC